MSKNILHLSIDHDQVLIFRLACHYYYYYYSILFYILYIYYSTLLLLLLLLQLAHHPTKDSGRGLSLLWAPSILPGKAATDIAIIIIIIIIIIITIVIIIMLNVTDCISSSSFGCKSG